MRRRSLPFRIAAGLLLALVLVHSAGWWWLSRQVRDGFAAWAAAQRALGRTVAGGEPALAGWPVAAGIDLPELAIAGPGWRWTADHTSLTVRPWAPSRLRVEPSGRQTFAAGPATLALEARATLLTLSLPAGDDPRLEVTAPVLDTPFGRLSADMLSGHMTAYNAVTADLDVSNLSLPPGPPYLLGAAVSGFDVQLATAGPLPPPRVAELAAWRDAGGNVRLEALHLQWGRLTLDAAGSAGLDRALQPLADIRVRMSGQDAALDQAAAQGLIQPRAASGIRAVLSLLASAQSGTIPASLHDGVVAVAGFPVARIPPVNWPLAR